MTGILSHFKHLFVIVIMDNNRITSCISDVFQKFFTNWIETKVYPAQNGAIAECIDDIRFAFNNCNSISGPPTKSYKIILKSVISIASIRGVYQQ